MENRRQIRNCPLLARNVWRGHIKTRPDGSFLEGGKGNLLNGRSVIQARISETKIVLNSYEPSYDLFLVIGVKIHLALEFAYLGRR